MKKFLRFAELVEGGVVTSRATLQRWIAQRGFPPGIKVGANTRLWPEEEVMDWIESQRDGKAA